MLHRGGHQDKSGPGGAVTDGTGAKVLCMGGVWFLPMRVVTHDRGGGGVQIEIFQALNVFFPFVQNSRPGGGWCPNFSPKNYDFSKKFTCKKTKKFIN